MYKIHKVAFVSLASFCYLQLIIINLIIMCRRIRSYRHQVILWFIHDVKKVKKYAQVLIFMIINTQTFINRYYIPSVL